MKLFPNNLEMKWNQSKKQWNHNTPLDVVKHLVKPLFSIVLHIPEGVYHDAFEFPAWVQCHQTG